MELRWSHLDDDAVPAWAQLTNLLAEADGTEEFYEAADLAEELEETGFSPARPPTGAPTAAWPQSRGAVMGSPSRGRAGGG